MDKFFYSNENFNILYKIIEKNIKNKFGKTHILRNELKMDMDQIYNNDSTKMNYSLSDIDKIKNLNRKVMIKFITNYSNKQNKINENKQDKKKKNNQKNNIQMNFSENNKNKLSVVEKRNIQENNLFKKIPNDPKLLYQNISNELDKSKLNKSYENKSKILNNITKYPVFPIKKNTYKTQKFIISIHSHLKNWGGNWVKNYDSNNNLISKNLVLNSNNFRYHYQINFTNDMLNPFGIKVNKIFKNVSGVKILRIILPTNEVDNPEMGINSLGSRVQPFISVGIDEISNNNIIQNENYLDYNFYKDTKTREKSKKPENILNVTKFKNNHFTRLYPTSFFKSEKINGQHILRDKIMYSNLDNHKKHFDINNLSSLNKLTVTVLNPYGKIYNANMDDIKIMKIDIYYELEKINRKSIVMNSRTIDDSVNPIHNAFNFSYRKYYFLLKIEPSVNDNDTHLGVKIDNLMKHDTILIHNLNLTDLFKEGTDNGDITLSDYGHADIEKLQDWFNTEEHLLIDSYVDDGETREKIYIKFTGFLYTDGYILINDSKYQMVDENDDGQSSNLGSYRKFRKGNNLTEFVQNFVDCVNNSHKSYYSAKIVEYFVNEFWVKITSLTVQGGMTNYPPNLIKTDEDDGVSGSNSNTYISFHPDLMVSAKITSFPPGSLSSQINNNYYNVIKIACPNNVDFRGNVKSNSNYQFIRINGENEPSSSTTYEDWSFKKDLKTLFDIYSYPIGTLINRNLQHTIELEIETQEKDLSLINESQIV